MGCLNSAGKGRVIRLEAQKFFRGPRDMLRETSQMSLWMPIIRHREWVLEISGKKSPGKDPTPLF